jgi:hypothetical protein
MSQMGSQKFAVFLCKFSDNSNVEPQPVDFYNELFALRGTGGLNDYWMAASQGAINLDGTEVFGWRTLNEKQADFLKAKPGRWDKIKGGIDGFPEVDASKYAGVVTMFNVDVGDAGMGDSGTQGGVLASPGAMSVTFLGHETGHVFGLEHSFDESDRKDVSWSAPGEYFDMYDIMSAMNVYSTFQQKFHESGPLLCAANLDRMGWLPASRVWSPPTGHSSWSDEFDIVSMSHPEIPGYLASHIGSVYVEFRTQESWDESIWRAGVLLHHMVDPNAVVIASDKLNYINDWQPGQMYGPSDLEMAFRGGIQIRIKSFDVLAKKARIAVRVAASRPIVAGPGQVFGGVAFDGGGLLILNGKIVRIPPYSPLMTLAEEMANQITAESGVAALASNLGLGRGVLSGRVVNGSD